MCHYTRAALQPHEALQSIRPPYNSNCAKLHASMMTRDEQSTTCLRVPATLRSLTPDESSGSGACAEKTAPCVMNDLQWQQNG
jgi:hypothetical protein